MNDIDRYQLNIIKKCNDFVNRSYKKKIDISSSPLCFLTTWAKNPGNSMLRTFLNKPLEIGYLIKNILSISKNHDLSFFCNKKLDINNNIQVVISYSTKNNFDKDGVFYDHYFNSNNKNKKNIWFLISLDNYIPNKLNQNIIIFSKKKKNSFNFVYFFKSLFFLILENKFSWTKFMHYSWFEYDFAKQVSKNFRKIFNGKKIKKVILNYESIPFQNMLLKTIKDINKKTITIGYLHCAPWPIQTDLIFRKILLDKLLVSSKEQKKVLINFLGWRKKNITVIPSLRFEKKKEKQLNGYIFLPFNLEKQNNYLKKFEELIIENKTNFGKIKIRIHPLNKKSLIHLEMASKFKKIISLNKKNFNGKKKIYLFSLVRRLVYAFRL